MPKSKIGLQFKGWTETMDKLDKLGGSDAMKRGVEAGLKASKSYVNPEIKKAVSKLPAGGKYSRPLTANTIDTDMDIDWQGLTGSVKVGFDFKKSGMTSIYLMYGTPRMDPVTGLKDAIYGNKTNRQIKKLQEDAVNKVIKRIMEGK